MKPRLSLNKETVRHITSEEMFQYNGGRYTYRCVATGNPCPIYVTSRITSINIPLATAQKAAVCPYQPSQGSVLA